MRHRTCEKCGNVGFTMPRYVRKLGATGCVLTEALVSHCLSCGFELREPCKDAKERR